MRITSKAAVAIICYVLAGSAHSGPPPYPEDLSAPNILKPVITIGGYGSEEGQFVEPHGAAFAKDGRLAVVDKFNGRVCIYPEDMTAPSCPSILHEGKAIRLAAPTAVAWISANSLAVTETGKQRAVVLSLADTSMTVSQTLDLGARSEPTGIAASPDRIYVSDRSLQQVVAFDSSGGRIAQVGGAGPGNGNFIDPTGLAVDDNGSVFVADSYNNRVQRFSRDLVYEDEFGDWGSYDGFLANPTSVSVAQETVFVADLINHRVQAFGLNGEYKFQWGRHPIVSHEGNGRLHYPEQVAVSVDGKRAAVCEPFEHRCQIFDLFAQTTPIARSDSAWWDKEGRFHYGARPTKGDGLIAISEPDTHSVLIFDNTGETPRIISRVGGAGRGLGAFIKPSGVAIDPATNTLFVSDAGNFRVQSFTLSQNVKSLDPSLVETPRFSKSTSTLKLSEATLAPKLSETADPVELPTEPSALVVAPDGLLLMCDPVGGRILELDSDLQLKRVLVQSVPKSIKGFRPNDLAFSPDGEKFYVVDFYHSRIAVFSRDGKFLFKFGSNGTGDGEFIHAFGIAVDKAGRVFVSDEAMNRISRFSADGQFEVAWGVWGPGPVEFYKPKGMVFDERDRLIIADFGNHRAQILSAEGAFISTFGIGQGYVPLGPAAALTPFTVGLGDTANLGVGDGAPLAGLTGVIPSNGGNYEIQYSFLSPSISANTDVVLEFVVRRTDGNRLPPNIKVGVSAIMPAHYHGLTDAPIFLPQGDGRFRVEELRFQMPGYWQFFVDIDNGIFTERAQIDLRI